MIQMLQEYWQVLDVSEWHEVCCMADEHTEGTQVYREIRGIFDLIKLPLCGIIHVVKREHKVLFEFSQKKKKPPQLSGM